MKTEKTESELLKELEAKISSVLAENVILEDVVSIYEDLKVVGTIDARNITGVDVKLSDTTSGNIVGMKFDNGKLDWSLLPIESVEEIIKVLMLGAKKYKPDNWKHVEDGDRRYFNAAMRHLVSWKQGEELDTETGLKHLAHCACCILFLISDKRIGYDIKE